MAQGLLTSGASALFGLSGLCLLPLRAQTRPCFSVRGNFTPRGRCLETFYYGSGVGSGVLLVSSGWRPERLLMPFSTQDSPHDEEPQVSIVSGGETRRKGKLRAGPAPAALGIPSATAFGGFRQAACPLQAPHFPHAGGTLQLLSQLHGGAWAWGPGWVAGVFSHLTLEDSLEQPFLRRFRRVTSVQVWREGTVRSKHVQLFKAFCFYHLEKAQKHGWCEGLQPPP